MTETKKFQKNIEDFVCEKCGFEVKGTGYTNHCPQCLWSKHVDINPGDRGAECQGMMEPVGLVVAGHSQSIIHRCLKCGKTMQNKVADTDQINAVIELSRKVYH